jgi:hypothetical protein
VNNRELIETILEGIAEDMVKDQSSKGIRASGKSAESFQIDAADQQGGLKGSSYFRFQFDGKGRGPGPFKDGVKTMLEWIKQKGITPHDPKTSLESLAFLFARKISQRGNDIFAKKREGIAVNEIVEKWKKILLEQYSKNLKAEILKST